MKKSVGIIAVIIAIVSLCCSAVCLFLTLNHSKASDTGDSVQYVMYVGTNDKDTYEPKYSEKEARDIVDGVCLKYFDGYTLQEATGSWTDEKNNITHEYTLVCYSDGAEKDMVYKAADDIIDALNQNTVLIEENNINMEYYSKK